MEVVVHGADPVNRRLAFVLSVQQRILGKCIDLILIKASPQIMLGLEYS